MHTGIPELKINYSLPFFGICLCSPVNYYTLIVQKPEKFTVRCTKLLGVS